MMGQYGNTHASWWLRRSNMFRNMLQELHAEQESVANGGKVLESLRIQGSGMIGNWFVWYGVRKSARRGGIASNGAKEVGWR